MCCFQLNMFTTGASTDYTGTPGVCLTTDKNTLNVNSKPGLEHVYTWH